MPGKGGAGPEIREWLAARADDPPPARTCPDCGRDISARHPAARRCEGCARERVRANQRRRRRRQSRALADPGGENLGGESPPRAAPVPQSVAVPNPCRLLKRRPKPALLLELEGADTSLSTRAREAAPPPRGSAR